MIHARIPGLEFAIDRRTQTEAQELGAEGITTATILEQIVAEHDEHLETLRLARAAGVSTVRDARKAAHEVADEVQTVSDDIHSVAEDAQDVSEAITGGAEKGSEHRPAKPGLTTAR